MLPAPFFQNNTPLHVPFPPVLKPTRTVFVQSRGCVTQRKQQGDLRSPSLTEKAEEVLYIDPGWLPRRAHASRIEKPKKRSRDVCRAVWAESPIRRFGRGRDWKGGGRKRERGSVCLRGISLWERESEREREQEEGRGVCVCVRWSERVCVRVCIAAVRSRGGMTAVSRADGRERAGDVHTPLKR